MIEQSNLNEEIMATVSKVNSFGAYACCGRNCRGTS